MNIKRWEFSASLAQERWGNQHAYIRKRGGRGPVFSQQCSSGFRIRVGEAHRSIFRDVGLVGGVVEYDGGERMGQKIQIRVLAQGGFEESSERVALARTLHTEHRDDIRAIEV